MTIFFNFTSISDRGKILDFFLTLVSTNQKPAMIVSIPTKVSQASYLTWNLNKSIFDPTLWKNVDLPSENVKIFQKFFSQKTPLSVPYHCDF